MPIDATKTDPHPLDAYRSAKPDEPIFTLQGGDRHAVPALRTYITERRNAGIDMPDGPKRNAELVRCTEAETILWAFQAYQAGHREEETAEAAAIPTETAALDLHDFRVWAAGRVSAAFSDLDDIRLGLAKRGYTGDGGLGAFTDGFLAGMIERLRQLYNSLEPRGSRHVDPTKW